MEENIITSIKVELDFLDGRLDDFINSNKLSDEAAVNLKSIVNSHVNKILFLCDKTQPYGSIKKPEKSIWKDLKKS